MTLALQHMIETTFIQQTSPEVILAAETLALASGALEAAVERELAANPALQRAPTRASRSVPGWDTSAGVDVAELLAEQEGDTQRLLSAVRLLLPAHEHELAEAVVGSLDSRLYLPIEPAQLADQLGTPVARVSAVVEAVRQAGPPGTAARDLRECLLAQLEELGADIPDQALVRAVVQDHLAALASGRLGEIARALRVSAADVASARELIRSRLRPCAVIEESSDRPPQPPPPPPELVFRASARGGHDVEVLECRRYALQIDPLYERAARESSSDCHLRADLARARRFLGRLEERWQTMRAVGEALALHQDAFLRFGPAHLCPLTRAQVARELGVHESTVSRAVSGKHAWLPVGQVVPLAAFFATSRDALNALRDLVAQEPQPLSDAMLAEAMRRRGFPIARRTVAKYRGVLAIPPVGRRRTNR
jgi:RNA polymerase sigma-54 factor